MGNEEVDLLTVVDKPKEKKSLLQKYDIPVEHLSYEYLTKCSNAKEVERIVLILRSGEEGLFPDLIRHGEKCLDKICPNSKVLRVEEPVLTRAMLEPEDRKIIDEDIEKWMNEMQGREKDLDEGKALSLTLPIPQPEIRQTPEPPSKSLESRNKRIKQKSIKSCDYSGWDKFDADAELDRIDLQDECKKVEAKNVQLEQRENYEKAKKLSKDSIVNKLTLTATELNVMAEQEKNIGNEAYRAGDYEEALIRYDSSIKINSSVNAYNNRAITNIKLERYRDAVDDCNVVLNMEYNNVTALMRRGFALEHLEKNSEALVDYQTILQLEPNNKTAISAVNKLRKPSDSKKVRIRIEEEKDNEVERKVPEPIRKNKWSNNDSIKNEMTEICFCDRAPGYSRSPKPPPHYKNSYCLSLPNSPPKTKILGHSKSQNSYFSNVNKSEKLIIEELPNDVHRVSSTSSDDKNNNNNNNNKLKKDNSKSENKKISEIGNVGDNIKKIEKSNSGVQLKQKKIDVASKYEKCGSKIVTANNEKIIIKDIESAVESPYEFLHVWESLKNDIDLSLHAKLLRSLSPENLGAVIGNKLDGNMFSTILKCLCNNFCTLENVDLIHRYLTSLTELSRFSIVHLFMDSNDKHVLEKILDFVNENISSDNVAKLRKAYNV